jgi:hypothetical protein
MHRHDEDRPSVFANFKGGDRKMLATSMMGGHQYAFNCMREL